MPSIVALCSPIPAALLAGALLITACFNPGSDTPLETDAPIPGTATEAGSGGTTMVESTSTVPGDTHGSADAESSSGGEPMCGNGAIEGDEECDDGGESATCDGDCTAASCGDGVVNDTAGETCDDGGPSKSCSAQCDAPLCGNGAIDVDAGEECDDGLETATCDVDCTDADCGDSMVNGAAGEECDEGRETAGCDADCTPSQCGDGALNVTAGETCDEGRETAGCDADCTPSECGDGALNVTAGETCDDGNPLGGDGCSTACGQNCQTVGGVLWCYDPDICGQACNQVCASAGLTPMADLDAWFQAQNEQAECDALAAAFGMMGGTSIAGYTYACLEDSNGNHAAQPLVGMLLCSDYNGCPMEHLTQMDGSPTDCSDPSSRRSICACE
jgi:cysteine-rich repeat protein